MKHISAILAVGLLAWSLLWAQTKTDGGTIFGGVMDGSAATKTVPHRVVSSLPGTCDSTKKETVRLSTDNKVYVCSSTNTWTVESGSGGGGDASTNTSSSVDSELAVFSGTGGKTFKRATQSGIMKLNSGVVGTAVTQGNGAKIQMFGTGTPATDDCSKFDANGNIVSAGAPCGTGGAQTVKTNGGTVGTRTTINLKNGVGTSLSGTDTGSQIEVPIDIDTGVVQTISDNQQSNHNFCLTAGTATAFTCDPAQAYTDAYVSDSSKYYKTGSEVLVNFHTGCGSNPTINVSGAAEEAPRRSLLTTGTLPQPQIAMLTRLEELEDSSFWKAQTQERVRGCFPLAEAPAGEYLVTLSTRAALQT